MKHRNKPRSPIPGIDFPMPVTPVVHSKKPTKVLSAGSTCPYCDAPVSLERLDDHKRLRCPKAPPEILQLRPTPLPKRKVKRSKAGNPFKSSKGGRLDRDIEHEQLKLAYARFVRDQRDSMSD